jgi:hypothetical protein
MDSFFNVAVSRAWRDDHQEDVMCRAINDYHCPTQPNEYDMNHPKAGAIGDKCQLICANEMGRLFVYSAGGFA